MNHAYYHRDQGRREKPVLLMIPGVVASLHTWACLRAAFAPHDRMTASSASMSLDLRVMASIRPNSACCSTTCVWKVDIAGSSLGGDIARWRSLNGSVSWC